MPVLALVSHLPDNARSVVIDLLPSGWSIIDCHADRDRLVREGAEVEVVYGNVRPQDVAALPRLRWIQTSWAGVENLLGPGHIPDDVIITNLRGQRATVMAEHVVTGLLWGTRQWRAFERSPDGWQPEQPHAPRTLAGSTALVLGCGAIGRALVPKLVGLGMRVLTVTRDGRRVPGADHGGTLADRQALAAQADHVVVLLPATPHTRGVVDAAFLGALRGGGVLVNVSRGAPVVAVDLLAAFDHQHLAWAVLDVTDPEPPADDDPLRRHPRVLLTGHRSYAGGGEPAASGPAILARNLQAWLAGDTGALVNVVDRAAGY